MNPLLTKAVAAVAGFFASKEQVSQVQMDQVVQTNARDRWFGPLARSYTPERVEHILRGALNGILRDQHELFNLMEETSPRINKNLNQRKRAVVSYLRTYKDWSEEDEPASDEAKRRTKVVATALRTMRPQVDLNENALDETIYDILDATGKGIAVLEVDWETRKAGSLGVITAPRCTRWLHPRFYGYPITADWLGLNVNEIESAAAANTTMGPVPPRQKLNPVNGVYARFPRDKFLICVRKFKSGSPIQGGLLRALAFWWAASNFTQSWFLNFAQIFGLPIRWANYDPNMPGLMEKVCAMLENMGSAAWGAFPTGTTLELKEPPKASAQNPQVVLLDLADKQYDLLILGQSGTTEISGPGKSGGSHAANKVLEGVEEMLVRSDADFVCHVINRQLIPAIIGFNFGDTDMLPELELNAVIIEDLKGLVENYSSATSAGVITPNPDDEAFVRKKLSLPNMSDAVLANWKTNGDVRKTPAAGAGGAPIPHDGTDLTLAGQAKSGGGTCLQARAKDSAIVNRALEDLTGVSEKWLGEVKPFFHELIAKAKDETLSDADFINALAKAKNQIPELFHKLDAAALAKSFESAMGAAAVNGAVRGALDRNSKSKFETEVAS